jgi:antimicrobial peptide system SdpB family protein
MLNRIAGAIRRWAAATNPWSNVYGFGRTLLALGSLSTLLFSHTDSLFPPTLGIEQPPFCFGATKLSLYCVVGPGYLEVGRWIAIGILALVASGWRPRITGVLHWWVAFSFTATAVLTDGGDAVANVMTLLLIPLTLTDGRKWHWQAADPAPSVGGTELRRIVALSTLFMLRLQVMGIYFHAAVGKFKVQEWADGTAVYYWFTDPVHGMTGRMADLFMPVLTDPYGVVALTWGAILLELALFMGIMADKKHRRKLLVLGLLFHGGIAFVHGLISFSLAMWGALVIYLRPVEEEFAFLPKLAAAGQRVAARVRRIVPAPTLPGPEPVAGD